MVQASKAEMLLAVDLWNRHGSEVNTAACVVHAQIAWLYLCHARFLKDGTDYWYRDRNGRRVRIDNEFRAWDLQRCAPEIYPNTDEAVRRNIEFFIAIRNKIEHRWEQGLQLVLPGMIQALILNYEAALEHWFDDSLADELRFPIFLSSLSAEAQQAVVHVWESLPKQLTSLIEAFDDRVPRDVAADPRYEFNVALIPYASSKAGSAVSMSFVRQEELTEEQRLAFEQVVTVIRDKQVPVQHPGELKPSGVAEIVQAALGYRFRPTPHHSAAWRYFNVRPGAEDPNPERTDARYCQHVVPFKSYVYTQAWVTKLVGELQDPARFQEVTGQPQESV